MSLEQAQAAAGMSPERLSRIEPVMSAYVDKLGYAGISVVLARRGHVVFRGLFGARDRDSGAPMMADTIFRIYSMTKPVAAVAVMTLVEEGRVRLTHPVDRFLPVFGDLRVLDESGTARKPIRPVTVRDLLTHTSGMGNELSPEPTGSHYRQSRLHADPSRTLAQFVDAVASLPLTFHPGTRWQYSVGLDVAARIVEVVTGEPFDQYLQRRIFDPLRMTDTSYVVPAEHLGRLAAVHGIVDIFKGKASRPRTSPQRFASAATTGSTCRTHIPQTGRACSSGAATACTPPPMTTCGSRSC